MYFLGARLSVNPQVPGSSPGRGAKKLNEILAFKRFQSNSKD